jgi:hypothetical protein
MNTTEITQQGSGVKERFMIFITYLNLSIRAFERNCNLNHTTIQNIKDGISSPNLAKIAAAYPDLSLDWLVTGQGEMLKSSVVQTTVSGDNVNQTVTGGNGKLNNKNRKTNVGDVSGGKVIIHTGMGSETDLAQERMERLRQKDLTMSERTQTYKEQIEHLKEQNDYHISIITMKDEHLAKKDEEIARLNGKIEEWQNKYIQEVTTQENTIKAALQKDNMVKDIIQQNTSLIGQIKCLHERINTLTDKLLNARP